MSAAGTAGSVSAPAARPGWAPAGPLRTSARRFELYVRASLYVLLAFQVLFAAGIGLGSATGGWPVAVLAVLVALQTGANIAVCRWALTAMRLPGRRPGPPARRLLAVWALVCLATWTFAVLARLDPSVADLVVRIVVLTPFAAVCPMLRRRGLWLAGAGCVLVTTALLVPLLAGSRGWSYLIGLSVGWVLAPLGVGFSFWTSGWMLRVVWALDDARGQAAALAIAEERLRISRDLHDVFGRTLTTVAVKSELSAELARRGRVDQAADEMAAVRRIADDAAREVRQVVSGVRHADLATELAGARSLLDSAGIRCAVTGEPPAGLSPAAAGALAWTLREAVTNVIRHSRAISCEIHLSGTDPVALTIANDGLGEFAPGPAGPGSGGNGLLGIGERLAAVGGTVRHHRGTTSFVLEAQVPARSGFGAPGGVEGVAPSETQNGLEDA